MATNFVARLTEAQVLQLCDCFQRIDANSDGKIDPSELDGFLRASFPGAGDDALAALHQAVVEQGDRDGDGKIDLNEFLAMITERQYTAVIADGGAAGAPEAGQNLQSIAAVLPTDEIDILRDCFIKLDANGDGFVDRAELMAGIKAVLQERFEPRWEYLSRIFDVADRDEDGKLSLTDFLASFADGPGVCPHEVVVEAVRSVRIHLRDEDIETLRESFLEFDTNGDGYLDKQELVEAMRRVLSDKFPDATTEEFEDIAAVAISVADADRDGRLNLSEFIRSFQEDQQVLPAAFIDGRAQSVRRRLTAAEIEAVTEAFRALDAEGSGRWEDFPQLKAALVGAIQPTLPEAAEAELTDIAEMLMVSAERDEAGQLALVTFAAQFTRTEQSAGGPAAVMADARRTKALERLDKVVADCGTAADRERVVFMFRALDQRPSGFIAHAELVGNLFNVLTDWFPHWADDAKYAAVDAVTSSAQVQDDTRDISIDDFVSLYAASYVVLPADSIEAVRAQLLKELTHEEMARAAQEVDQLVGGAAFVGQAKMHEHIVAAVSTVVLPRAVGAADAVMVAVGKEGSGPVSVSDVSRIFRGNASATIAASSGEEPQPSTPPAPVALGQRPHTSTAGTQSEGRAADGRPATTDLTVRAMNPTTVIHDVTNATITDEQLREAFDRLDVNGNGFLDRGEFQKAFLTMESFGCKASRESIFNRTFRTYCRDDGKISFDEFCIFMLQSSRW